MVSDGCGLHYRNVLKEVLEGSLGKGSYQGPDECISDSTESKYFNNDEVCCSPGMGNFPISLPCKFHALF